MAKAGGRTVAGARWLWPCRTRWRGFRSISPAGSRRSILPGGKHHEPCFDLAHLAHVEVYTDRFDESLDFFTRVYGLKLSGQDDELGLSARLGRLRVPLAEADPPPTPPASAISPIARPRPRRWSAAWRRSRPAGYKSHRLGRGRSGPWPRLPLRRPVRPCLRDLLGHQPLRAAAAMRSALKNLASQFHAQGACPRRIDHVNLLGEDVTAFRDFVDDLPRQPGDRT